MEKDEVKRRMENICEQLESNNEGYRSAAINAFNNLIQTEKVSEKQLEEVIPPIKKIITDPKCSLRTDFFKAASFIGVKDFSLIEDIFDSMVQELEEKNRFRTKTLIDMLIKLKNSNHPPVQNAIEKVIKDAPELFDESYLVPILKTFWQKSLEKDFQFLERYQKLIEEHINEYPPVLVGLNPILRTA